MTQELKDKIQKKLIELNMEIIKISENEKILTLKCKTHPNKPERDMKVENFLKAKTCGCRLKFYDKEDFQEDIKETGFIVSGEYINDSTKIKLICPEGHEFEATPNKIKQGRGCPFCKGEKLRRHFLKSTEQFKKDLEKVNPSLELKGEYNGSHEEVSYKCKVCGRTSHGVADKLLQRELGCRFCNASIGEQIITVTLENMKVNFEVEYSFDDCKNINKLRFDFYLPDYNLCIEFQGEQHFRPVDFSYTPTQESKEKAEEIFKKNQERDEIKRDYCKNNNIKLLEISYKQMDDIETILKENLNNN